MRSATLLAFVDCRPSAVKSTILVLAAGCGLALERRLGASLGYGAPEEELFVAYVSTRVRGQPCRLRGRGFIPRSAPSWAATSGFVLEGRPKLAPSAWLRAVANTCFGRIRGINHSYRAGSRLALLRLNRTLCRVPCTISGSRSIN